VGRARAVSGSFGLQSIAVTVTTGTVNFHVFHHFSECAEREHSGILKILATILENQHTMTAELQTLTDAVAASKTVSESAITLLQGIAAQLVALKDNPAAIAALATDLNNETAAMSAAITANTPPAA
jgi:hypothetical protein